MTFDLEFDYTFEDYLEASRLSSRRRRLATVSWYFLAIMFILAAIFTAVEAVLHDPISVSIEEMLIAAVFLFLTSPLFLRIIVRVRWKMQPQLQSRVHYQITPDAVRAATNTSKGETTWEGFVRFIETKNVFLLYPNKLIFHIIPKRAFASPDELASFRALATSKIPPPKRSYLPWR